MAKFTDGVFTITSPIQHRRGTTATLESSDYIPAAGEIIIATDTGLIKAGDGVHTWADLPAGNQISSQLESRIANIERILRDVNLYSESAEYDDTDEDNINEIFDDIFSSNNSSEPTENNNDSFDDTINSILNS